MQNESNQNIESFYKRSISIAALINKQNSNDLDFLINNQKE